MKIGDRVTVDEVITQSEHRWVVLTDLEFSELGGVSSGVIRFIAHTRREAGLVFVDFWQNNVAAYLVSGSWEELVLGGVFVE